ncbi:glycosyltransferase [Devosia soli]|nr:glycosyltransferase [Devosia soli]
MSSSKRIYFVSPIYPTVAEPASGTFIQALAEGLKGEGWEVDLRAVGLSDRGGKFGKLERYIRLCLGSLALVFCKPGIVYVHLPTWFSIFLWPSRLRRSLPMAIHAHGSEIHGRNRLAQFFWPLTRPLFKRAERIVVPSATFAKAVLLATERDAEIVSPSGGFDEDLFDPEGPSARQKLNISDSAVVVGYASRIVESKGWRIFLDAFEDYARTNDGAVAIMIGIGRDAKTLEAEIRTRGLSEKVKYIGAVPRSEMALYFRAMSVFLFVSKIENTDTLGLVAVEAIACGTPTIALDRELTREYLAPGRNGVLVEAWTGHSFSQAIDEARALARSEGGRSILAATVSAYNSRQAAQGLSERLKEIAPVA